MARTELRASVCLRGGRWGRRMIRGPYAARRKGGRRHPHPVLVPLGPLVLPLIGVPADRHEGKDSIVADRAPDLARPVRGAPGPAVTPHARCAPGGPGLGARDARRLI